MNLISTLVILILVCIAYLQMTYLSFRVPMGYDDKCITVDHDGSEVCSIWGSAQAFSFLFNPLEINVLNGDGSPGVGFLSFIFYVALLFGTIYSVAITIISIQQIKLKDFLVSNYWVPLFIHISLVQDFSSTFSCERQDRQYEQKQFCSSIGNTGCYSGFEQRMGSTWDFIISSFECTQNRNSKWWSYQRSFEYPTLIGNVQFVRLIGVLLIPLWMVIGLLSLGMLWPPQFRRWILTWSNDEVISEEKEKSAHLSKKRNTDDELIRMKCMMFDRFDDIHAEIDYIKRGLS